MLKREMENLLSEELVRWEDQKRDGWGKGLYRESMKERKTSGVFVCSPSVIKLLR